MSSSDPESSDELESSSIADSDSGSHKEDVRATPNSDDNESNRSSSSDTDDDVSGSDDRDNASSHDDSRGGSSSSSSSGHTSRRVAGKARLRKGGTDRNFAGDLTEDSEDGSSDADSDVPSVASRLARTSADIRAPPRVPELQLHPWQRVTSRSESDLRPLEEKFDEARRLAKMALDSGQANTHAHYLTRAVSLSSLLHGHTSLITIDLRRQLAEAYMDVLEYVPQAAQHAKEVLKALRSGGTNSSRDVESEAPNLPGLATSNGGGEHGNNTDADEDHHHHHHQRGHAFRADHVVVIPSGVQPQLTGSASVLHNGVAMASGGEASRGMAGGVSVDYIEFRCLLCLGKAEQKQNRSRVSVRTLEEADRRHRRIVQTTGRCDVADIVALATARSRALGSLRRTSEAANVIRKAISYCSQLMESEASVTKATESPISTTATVSCADLYMQLGTILNTGESRTDAMAAIREARTLLKTTTLRQSERTAECDLRMAHMLMESPQHQGGSPEAYLRRALKVLHRLHGRQHPKALEIQEDIARLMVQSSRNQDAVDLLKEVIHDKAAVFGDPSVELGKSYQLLGTLCLASGNLSDAHSHLTKAKELLSSLLGSSNRQIEQLNKLISMLDSSQTQQGGRNRQRFAV
ncbi:uncharacterized protein LOC135827857 [Sycon ciliatum]|uniref:uncharacterized protein LOC135827857 n=1 Tax=Sycon ciliatum TaxID=27933 RepID=UPI0031F66449